MFQLDMKSRKSIYEQVMDNLKELIMTGTLTAGEKLPSVRLYAVEHRVNPNTVAKAYTALEADGYLRVQPKQGAYVCYGESIETQTEEQDELTKQVSVWKQAGVTKERIENVLAQVYGGDGV